MKLTVCKGCGNKMMAINAKTKEPACPVCFGIREDSGIQVEIEVGEISRCVYCGQEAKWDGECWMIGTDKPRGREGIRGRGYKELPFQSVDGTYYCGCKGWD